MAIDVFDSTTANGTFRVIYRVDDACAGPATDDDGTSTHMPFTEHDVDCSGDDSDGGTGGGSGGASGGGGGYNEYCLYEVWYDEYGNETAENLLYCWVEYAD